MNLVSDDDEKTPTDLSDELRKIMKGLQRGVPDTCDVEGCEFYPSYRKGVSKMCESHAREARKVYEADMEKLRLERLASGVDDFIAESLGRSYTRCTWDGLDITENQKKSIRDAVGRGGSVILTGEPGRGKTHALTCVLRDLYVTGATCEVWTCSDLFDHLRMLAIGDDPKARKTFIEHFRDVDWLFFDDLGVGKDSEFTLEQLFRIIDWRSRDESPVVVTSNLTMDELGEKYDRRLSSRLGGLVKQAGGYGLRIEGRDHRKGGK